MPLSTTLHDNVPTQLRGLAYIALSTTGNVLVRTLTDDGAGGQAETYAAGSSIPCRVDPLGGGEAEAADRIDERTTHLITVPPATSVKAQDRFSVSGIGNFEITAVRTRTDENVRVLEAVEDQP